MKPSAIISASSPRQVESHIATRETLLNAAEQLFSEQGIEGTSVRDITRAAAANLGAINYHFGSKDRLAIEVFARRLKPLNCERVARLDALEKAAGPEGLRLEQILDAMVRPTVEGVADGLRHETAFMRLISRCFQEPNPELKQFVQEQFEEVASRFDAAILRVVPGLTQGELFWKMKFLFGALHLGLEMWMRDDVMTCVRDGEMPTPLDTEGFIQRVVAFGCAGFAAPLPGPSTTPL
jgi:AcrR family transcriptional regulator